jgi:predicted Zn-dependent peptidase
MYLAWRLPAANHEDMPVLTVLENILNNGSTGLIDVNINQAQKVLGGAGGGVNTFVDHSCFILSGRPKQGQSLQDVQDLLMEQIEKLKKGEFDESMIASVINNYKKYQMSELENYTVAADKFVTSFIYEIPWANMVAELDNMAKVTKEEIVAAANKYFTNGYVSIFKEQGKAPQTAAISKPAITPILTNRDKQSDFLKQIQAEAAAAKPIEPVFVDFNKDMQKGTAKSGVEVLYKKNEKNDLFQLSIAIDFGSKDNKVISFATGYFGYLGTAEKTAAQIKKELYDLACNASVSASGEKIYISVSGLSENMEAALAIIEDKIANVKGDDAVLANYKANVFRQRINSKTNQRGCYSMLTQYINYGKEVNRNVLSNSEIQALTSEQLLNEIKDASKYEQMITYYGPMEMADVVAVVEKYHNIPEKLEKYPKQEDLKLQVVNEPKVVIAPYNAKQIYMISYSNTGEVYDPAQTPIVNMYNEYFGGGMNSIVFQEMREARGLAYSANARYAAPGKKDQTYYFTTFIATQNDKMMDAVNAFDEIVNQMPQSEAAFNIAKENIIANMRTSRIQGMSVINYWLNLQKRGLSEDPNKELFEKVQQFTLQDVVDFQQKVIKDRKYVIGILGSEKDLDMKAFSPEKYGKVERVSLEDIFGY